jgi:hypothetical protein
MRAFRPFVTLAALLLSGVNIAAGAEVLVPGDPPLTRSRLDGMVQSLEWSLGLALRPSQREECSQLLLARWKAAGPDVRQALVHRAEQWEELAGSKSRRDQAHAQARADTLTELRKQDDPASRMLLRAHEAAQQVLVPGNPKGGPRNDRRLEPLTQGMVDAYAVLAESVLDFSLTEQQGREYQKLLIAEWQKAQNDYWGSPWQARVIKDLAWWSDVRCRGGAERGPALASYRTAWLPELRRSSSASGNAASASDRQLLSFYQAAFEPGGSRNSILVAGKPPLTQVFLEWRALFAEWIIELPLSRPEWEKYRELLVEDWKQWPQVKKEEMLRGKESWGDLFDYCVPYERGQNIKDIEGWWLYFPTFTPYYRNSYRLTLQRRVLEAWAKDEAGASERFLVGLHQAAYRPGGERNPVLVDGNSPLTQAIVNRYADHLEILLDTSVVGGFTTPQRQALKDLVIKDWKKMDLAARKEFLDSLGEWDRRMEMKLARERFDLQSSQKARLLAQLRSTGDQERSQWLLQVRKDAEEVYQTKLRAIKDHHELVMTIIRNMAPSGRWEYNPSSGRYDRWVPNR